jgi:hypothetical protein
VKGARGPDLIGPASQPIVARSGAAATIGGQTLIRTFGCNSCVIPAFEPGAPRSVNSVGGATVGAGGRQEDAMSIIRLIHIKIDPLAFAAGVSPARRARR